MLKVTNYLKKEIYLGKYTWLFLALALVSSLGACGVFYWYKLQKFESISVTVLMILLLIPSTFWCTFTFSFSDWMEIRRTDGTVPLEEDKRSLKRTLAYMSGKVLQKTFDVLNFIEIGMFGFGGLGWAIYFGTEKEIGIVIVIILGLIVWTVLLHCLMSYIKNNKNRMVKRVLENSKEYVDYGDEAEFTDFVDRSLRNDMIFRCKNLVLTKDVVLGRIDNDREFLPVAVLRREVLSDSFYVMKRIHGRGRRAYKSIDGILELRLKNGNVIKLYTSEGFGNDRVRRMLLDAGKTDGVCR